MFFIPERERVTDDYWEALFDYWPRRLPDQDICLSVLRVPRNRRIAFGINCRPAAGQPIELCAKLQVKSTNHFIAETGQSLEDFRLLRDDLKAQTFPFPVHCDFFGFWELQTRGLKGKCEIKLTYIDRQGQHEHLLPVEVY